MPQRGYAKEGAPPSTHQPTCLGMATPPASTLPPLLSGRRPNSFWTLKLSTGDPLVESFLGNRVRAVATLLPIGGLWGSLGVTCRVQDATQIFAMCGWFGEAPTPILLNLGNFKRGRTSTPRIPKPGEFWELKSNPS